MKVVVLNHMSLDGVIQGPGRPDEDTREGFAHGWRTRLWTPPYGEHALSSYWRVKPTQKDGLCS